jgi:hypothetical protein
MCYTPSNLDFTAKKAYEILCQNLDKTLVIVFKKRTDGTKRRMVAICYSKLNGTFTTQNNLKKGLFQVWDCEKGDRRSVPLENIWEIKAGNTVLFDQFETVQAEIDAMFG